MIGSAAFASKKTPVAGRRTAWCSTSLRAAVLACAAWGGTVDAVEPPGSTSDVGAAADCTGAGSDIAAGNAAALAVFTRHVVDAAAVGQAPREAPAGFFSAESHGARGDGATDDSDALQRALTTSRRVWLRHGGVYLVRHRLTLGDGASLTSDGSATLLMAAGPAGFDNRVAVRGDAGLYSEHGTGLRLTGHDVAVADIFIVKAYADDRYVIGIDVSEASRVVIRRVRLRGFSLAPGIVTIRSADDVQVDSTLIHASCTRSTAVPPDVASFQITGISVDDSRVGGRGSTGLRLHNNVITDLTMAPLTARGEQTDGINFAAIGSGTGSVLAANAISGVDEGIDLFGAGIEVRGNRVAARGLPVKLIHGAHAVTIVDNDIAAAPGGRGAIGLFRAHPPEPRRQVSDVVVDSNRIALPVGETVAIHVDAGGPFAPRAIALRRNVFTVERCGAALIACSPDQCSVEGNRKVAVGRAGACAAGTPRGRRAAAKCLRRHAALAGGDRLLDRRRRHRRRLRQPPAEHGGA